MTKRVLSLFSGCGGLDYGFINNPSYSHVFVDLYRKTGNAVPCQFSVYLAYVFRNYI
jgi:site-specific DNA-cytosine methylase